MVGLRVGTFTNQPRFVSTSRCRDLFTDSNCQSALRQVFCQSPFPRMPTLLSSMPPLPDLWTRNLTRDNLNNHHLPACIISRPRKEKDKDKFRPNITASSYSWMKMTKSKVHSFMTFPWRWIPSESETQIESCESSSISSSPSVKEAISLISEKWTIWISKYDNNDEEEV